jgi:hypothetical protein
MVGYHSFRHQLACETLVHCADTIFSASAAAAARSSAVAWDRVLQTIQVIEQNSIHAAHIRIDIARHADIHDHERHPIALHRDTLGFLAAQQIVWTSRGADHNVGLQHALPAIGQRGRSAAQLLRNLLGPRRRLVDYHHRFCSVLNHLAGGQFAHLARAQ